MYGTGNTLQNQKQPTLQTQSPAKSALVFASRKLNETNQLILPKGGEQLPSPYIPFLLNAYANGTTALAALAKKGFKYTLGGTATQQVSAPDLITTNSANGTVDLIWNSTTTGLETLASSNPSGSATQLVTTATGSIKKITVTTDNTTVMTVVLVNGSAAFNMVNKINVTVVLPFNTPNPNLSDEVCVFAYWYFQKRAASPNFATSPNLWVSTLIKGVNTSISPQAAPIELVAPTTVGLLADGSYNLTYSVTDANLGLLPTAFLGASIATQDSVTGTYNGLIVRGTEVIINITNPSGEFATTGTVSIQLDISQNGGMLMGKTEIGGVAMCYPVSNQQELEENHPDFVGLVAYLRQPSQVQNNKFNVLGYYGFVPSFIGQYPLSHYTAPDTDAYCFTVKIDIPTLFQPACNNVAVVAQSLYTDMMNEGGYEADAGVGAIVNMPISTNKASQISNEQCDQLVSQGCTTIAYTETNTGYWYQRVCTLQTVGDNIDNEYRYISFQNKLRWLDKNIELGNRNATINPTTGQRRNNNPSTINSVKVNGQLVLTDGVDNGILGSIGNSVTATLNPSDVTRILQTVTTSIVSQNNGVDAIVVVRSYEV